MGISDRQVGSRRAIHFQIARTASRSVLGFMNEMAFHIRRQADEQGGLENCNLSIINRRLRRTLHSRDGYAEPLELVARWIESGGANR